MTSYPPIPIFMAVFMIISTLFIALFLNALDSYGRKIGRTGSFIVLLLIAVAIFFTIPTVWFVILYPFGSPDPTSIFILISTLVFCIIFGNFILNRGTGTS